MKIFSKKSKRRDEDDDNDYQEEDDGRQPVGYPAYPNYQKNLQASEPTNQQNEKKKKKKGFKSLFKGKTKKNPQTGRDENSLYDYDPQNPPQQYSSGRRQQQPPGPGSQRSRMDPKLFGHIEDSDDSSSSDDDEFHTSLKPVEEGDEEEEEESEGELKDDSRGGTKRVFNQRLESMRRRRNQILGPDDSDDDDLNFVGISGRDFLVEDAPVVESITLVILLFHPQTLRFELLQLELDDVKGLKVKDVIEQLEDSITEPALKELHFVGLVDRAGGRHKGESSLSKALRKRRNHTKDILVGLSKGVSIDEVFKRARPILGDPNVGRMVS